MLFSTSDYVYLGKTEYYIFTTVPITAAVRYPKACRKRLESKLMPSVSWEETFAGYPKARFWVSLEVVKDNVKNILSHCRNGRNRFFQVYLKVTVLSMTSFSNLCGRYMGMPWICLHIKKKDVQSRQRFLWHPCTFSAYPLVRVAWQLVPPVFRNKVPLRCHFKLKPRFWTK